MKADSTQKYSLENTIAEEQRLMEEQEQQFKAEWMRNERRKSIITADQAKKAELEEMLRHKREELSS